MSEKRDVHDWTTLGIAASAFVVACAGAAFSYRQAKVASEELELQRDFDVRQLRAYVEVLDNTPDTMSPAGGHFVSKLRLKNTGLTPAYGLKDLNHFWVVPFDQADKIHLNSLPADAPVISVVLGSQQEVLTPITSGMVLSPIQIDAFTKRVAAFISYGTIRYTDVYGNRRYTEYCAVYKAGDPGVWCPQHALAD